MTAVPDWLLAALPSPPETDTLEEAAADPAAAAALWTAAAALAAEIAAFWTLWLEACNNNQIKRLYT